MSWAAVRAFGCGFLATWALQLATHPACAERPVMAVLALVAAAALLVGAVVERA